MLSLMAFIFVVKVFHTHGNHSCADLSVKGDVVNHICAICEYHFAKDADNFHSVITIPSSVNYLLFNTCKISDYFFAVANIISPRGPPFFCWFRFPDFTHTGSWPVIFLCHNARVTVAVNHSAIFVGFNSGFTIYWVLEMQRSFSKHIFFSIGQVVNKALSQRESWCLL